MTPTYYEILEVLDGASADAIKGAYKHLAQRWHPDKNPENLAFSDKKTSALTEAYRTLINPEARARYDQALKQERKASAEASSTAEASRHRPGPQQPVQRPPQPQDHEKAPTNGKRVAQQPSSRKSIGDYVFGFIFIGFLLNLVVGVIVFRLWSNFTSHLPESTYWFTYLSLSLLAAYLWRHDFRRKEEGSAVNQVADGVGLHRAGHGPMAVGIGVLLLIVGKLVIVVQGLQHIDITDVLLIAIIGTSVWVWNDARRIGARKGQLRGFVDLSPVGWFVCCLLLWVIAFPTYLWIRPQLTRINRY